MIIKSRIQIFLSFACIIAFSIPAESKQSNIFNILFIGDILCVNEIEKYALQYGNDYPFKKITPELLKYDFVIGNLEAPITENRSPNTIKKAYIFKTMPSLAQCLQYLRIDGVTLANNHLCDYGANGIKDTLQYLTEWNIQHAGGGLNLADARKPMFIKYSDAEIVIFSYNNRPPATYYATSDRAGTVALDLNIIRSDIDTYKTNSNFIIISVHWGIEQTNCPLASQIAFAHTIIDAGADAVVGHHPHWPQGIEIYKSKPIIYSLGNFVNGYINKIEKNNIMISFSFEGSRLQKISIIPITGRNKIIQFQPSIMIEDEAKKMIFEIQNLSKPFRTIITDEKGQGVIYISK